MKNQTKNGCRVGILKYHLWLIMFFSTIKFAPLFAQTEPSKNQLHPCGTPASFDPELNLYFQNRSESAHRDSGDTLFVALKIHLLATTTEIRQLTDGLPSGFYHLVVAGATRSATFSLILK